MAQSTAYSDAVAHARDVRKRLRNPTNAVADRGIELRPTPIAKVIPIPAQEPPEKPPAAETVPAPPPERLASFSRLKRRIRLVVRLLERLEQRRGLMERSLQPSIETIMKATCAHFGVSMVDMQSHRRSKYILRPRQIAAYVAKQLTTRSLPQIARRMGRDHTTIIHSIRKIEALRGSDPQVDEAVRAITDMLHNVARDV